MWIVRWRAARVGDQASRMVQHPQSKKRPLVWSVLALLCVLALAWILWRATVAPAERATEEMAPLGRNTADQELGPQKQEPQEDLEDLVHRELEREVGAPQPGGAAVGLDSDVEPGDRWAPIEGTLKVNGELVTEGVIRFRHAESGEAGQLQAAGGHYAGEVPPGTVKLKALVLQWKQLQFGSVGGAPRDERFADQRSMQFEIGRANKVDWSWRFEVQEFEGEVRSIPSGEPVGDRTIALHQTRQFPGTSTDWVASFRSDPQGKFAIQVPVGSDYLAQAAFAGRPFFTPLERHAWNVLEIPDSGAPSVAGERWTAPRIHPRLCRVLAASRGTQLVRVPKDNRIHST